MAMDDFGTGYSSLPTLQAFPFDKIKLDQSFVKRLPDDAAAAAIVRTVLALGESLGMPVFAEGIETEAQWQFLAREGCAKGQGYLFAKPVPVAKLPASIRDMARFARDQAPPSNEIMVRPSPSDIRAPRNQPRRPVELSLDRASGLLDRREFPAGCRADA